MIINQPVQQITTFIFLVIVAAQIQGAQDYTPDAEKALADITYNDIIAFNVKNATKEGVKLVTKYGYKLPAKHWSVFYDSLIFYAQEEVHLPPLEDFPLAMQTTIKAHWERAQKLGAHLIDCQGIDYLTKTLKLPVPAEQWPISRHDFLFFFENKVILPPLEEFTVERQKKIFELLRKLGDKAPRISSPKPKMPILANKPITKPPTSLTQKSSPTPSLPEKAPSRAPLAPRAVAIPQARVQTRPSPLATNMPQSALPEYRQAQPEILPELSDITWNPSFMEANNQPAQNQNPSYVHTQLSHNMQPMPVNASDGYQANSWVADIFVTPQASSSNLWAHAYRPAHEPQNLPPQPSSAMGWNFWDCTPAWQESGHTDLLLPSSSAPSGLADNQAIIIPAANAITVDNKVLEPVDIVDLTRPLTTHNIQSSHVSQAPSPDSDLMAQFLRLSEPSPKVDSRPLAPTTAAEQELRRRLDALLRDDAPKAHQENEQDEDAQLEARLKALGTIQRQSPKKARQLAYEHQ